MRLNVICWVVPRYADTRASHQVQAGSNRRPRGPSDGGRLDSTAIRPEQAKDIDHSNHDTNGGQPRQLELLLGRDPPPRSTKDCQPSFIANGSLARHQQDPKVGPSRSI
ncbi:hypothetical protein ACCO45_013345 [Purpureocillium lilacinum]|uniref:Uncharacterized protein n=1 Tax=Purpureocillium lilacinum TaxID=33203 RepID=A0ACC4DC45_PURLI